MFGFMSLFTTLIAVACTQFDKLNAAILHIRQQVTPHQVQEDQRDRTTVNCYFQGELNACIQHHQDINGYVLQEL